MLSWEYLEYSFIKDEHAALQDSGLAACSVKVLSICGCQSDELAGIKNYWRC